MNKKNAFTLIEIMLVIVIIAVLSGLVVAVINPEQLRKKARDANRQKDMSIVSEALGQYYADNNAYPTGNYASAGTALTTGSTVYIKTMPVDASYCYVADASAQNYVICATMEAMDDERNGIPDTGTVSVSACTGSATGKYYCVTNPF